MTKRIIYFVIVPAMIMSCDKIDNQSYLSLIDRNDYTSENTGTSDRNGISIAVSNQSDDSDNQYLCSDGLNTISLPELSNMISSNINLDIAVSPIGHIVPDSIVWEESKCSFYLTDNHSSDELVSYVIVSAKKYPLKSCHTITQSGSDIVANGVTVGVEDKVELYSNRMIC